MNADRPRGGQALQTSNKRKSAGGGTLKGLQLYRAKAGGSNCAAKFHGLDDIPASRIEGDEDGMMVENELFEGCQIVGEVEGA